MNTESESDNMSEDRIADVFIIGAIITVIVLKLTGVITLSWFWLLSPLWGLFALGLIGAVSMTLMCLIMNWIQDRRKK
jgi:hypothetical protein